jgi:CDP-glucose 4,6-dehydratase
MENLGLAFAGRSVFITGHTGFKGSWLALWLAELGAKVSGFSLPPPTSPSNFEVSRIAERLVRHDIGDIRDLQSLSTAMREARPSLAIHMAAQPLVRESYLHPVETFGSNVMGTVNFLESVRHLDHPCVALVVTSDKCYDNVDQLWGYRETDRMGGSDPYSASKGAAELVVRAYRDSFFAPDKLARHGKKVASVRAGNVIGGGDWAADRLLVDLVRGLTAGEPAMLRNPRSTRPWQHVLDALGGYLTLAVRMLESDAPWLCDGWNFGPDSSSVWTVERIAKAFFEAWQGGQYVAASAPPELHEARGLCLDSTKAREVLGWQPHWTTALAVAKTAAWYQRYYTRGAPMLDACLEDIQAFSAMRA